MVVIAPGFHLFPFRTEKLSPVAPMVLQCDAGEYCNAMRESRRPPFFKFIEYPREEFSLRGYFFCPMCLLG